MEIHITNTIVYNTEQKRAELLLTGGEGLREIWRNFLEQKTKRGTTSPGTSKRGVYQAAVHHFDKHSTLKENIPNVYTFF